MIGTSMGSSCYDPSQWRINWRQIAEDIRNAGLPFHQQAFSLGREWSTYQRWRSGSEPKFSDGQALLVLHTHFCGSELTQTRLKEIIKKL